MMAALYTMGICQEGHLHIVTHGCSVLSLQKGRQHEPPHCLPDNYVMHHVTQATYAEPLQSADTL